MSDFFDDENLTENADEKPAEIKKEAAPKKLWPKILAAVLAVAILGGGTFAVFKLVPEKEEETETASTYDGIDVLSVDTDKISYINYENENGRFKIYKKTEKSSDDDSSESGETVKWYLDGVKTDLIDTGAASSTVSSTSTIKGIRKITEKTDKECGLDKPVAKAEIVKTDKSKITVSVGGESPDNSGCYLKISKYDDIFLVEDSVKEAFIFDALHFADASSMPPVDKEGLDDYFDENSTLTKFDELSVSGEKYQNPLVIVPNTDAAISEYIPYKITSPEEHYADGIDDILAFFQTGVTANGAYSYDTSPAEISKFGLDNPDFTVTLKLGKKTFVNSFKLTENGDYAALSGNGRFIYKVDASSVSGVADGDVTKYYSAVISLFNINTLKSLNVNAEGKDYNFGIKKLDSDDTENDYRITYNGKKLDCSSFKNLYQYLLTFGCYDYTVGETSKDDSVTVTYNFNDGGSAEVKFEKSSETKYQYSYNGKPIGKIQSSKVDKFVKYTKKYASGEKISQLN